MDNTKKKAIIRKAGAWLAALATYVGLYTIASNYLFGKIGIEWGITSTYVWYAFFIMVSVCSCFDVLVFMQILIWGMIGKFAYSSVHPYQSLAILCIGLVAIGVNIAIRRYKLKQ